MVLGDEQGYSVVKEVFQGLKCSKCFMSFRSFVCFWRFRGFTVLKDFMDF